jgi:hypothetical protein
MHNSLTTKHYICVHVFKNKTHYPVCIIQLTKLIMKKMFKLSLLGLLATMVFVGCYPDDDDATYSDFDVAVTYHDKTFNFKQITSVVLLDTVVHVVGEDEAKPTKPGDYDGLAVTQVYNNLVKLYGADSIYLIKSESELPANAKPQLVLTLTAFQTDVYYGYSYPYWGYYWGWYGGWYWWWKKSGPLKSTEGTQYYPYYPYYPTTGYSYAYTTGTLMIDMIDIKNAKPEFDILPVAWTGAINGILSSNKADIQSRIKSNIDQCFTQSPYLQ